MGTVIAEEPTAHREGKVSIEQVRQEGIYARFRKFYCSRDSAAGRGRTVVGMERTSSEGSEVA